MGNSKYAARVTGYAEVIPETRTHDYFRLADHSTVTEKLGEPMWYKLPLP
jgi:hypothetical protein